MVYPCVDLGRVRSVEAWRHGYLACLFLGFAVIDIHISQLFLCPVLSFTYHMRAYLRAGILNRGAFSRRAPRLHLSVLLCLVHLVPGPFLTCKHWRGEKLLG